MNFFYEERNRLGQFYRTLMDAENADSLWCHKQEDPRSQRKSASYYKTGVTISEEPPKLDQENKP
jgi:hypothetical protein